MLFAVSIAVIVLRTDFRICLIFLKVIIVKFVDKAELTIHRGHPTLDPIWLGRSLISLLAAA